MKQGAVEDESLQLASLQQGVQVETIKQLEARQVEYEHHFLAGAPCAVKAKRRTLSISRVS